MSTATAWFANKRRSAKEIPFVFQQLWELTKTATHVTSQIVTCEGLQWLYEILIDEEEVLPIYVSHNIFPLLHRVALHMRNYEPIQVVYLRLLVYCIYRSDAEGFLKMRSNIPPGVITRTMLNFRNVGKIQEAGFEVFYEISRHENFDSYSYTSQEITGTLKYAYSMYPEAAIVVTTDHNGNDEWSTLEELGPSLIEKYSIEAKVEKNEKRRSTLLSTIKKATEELEAMETDDDKE